MTEADELKQEGNESFRAGRWSEALVSYRTALSRLPMRKKQPVSPDGLQDGGSDEGARSSSGEVPAQEENSEQVNTPTKLQTECCKARAVLNANIGACLVKLVCESVIDTQSSEYLTGFNDLGRL